MKERPSKEVYPHLYHRLIRPRPLVLRQARQYRSPPSYRPSIYPPPPPTTLPPFPHTASDASESAPERNSRVDLSPAGQSDRPLAPPFASTAPSVSASQPSPRFLGYAPANPAVSKRATLPSPCTQRHVIERTFHTHTESRNTQSSGRRTTAL
ncbi:hypothetical protein R3P38DRAFT_3238717 [Favolaschia claudopus]|uniref:Uncharacterized protein n=1 Tax=Favolaschia claudopus TaxID=2862362 RepID=A0AAV9Z982_9AGAR